MNQMNSQELFERSKKVAPGGVHSPVRAFKSVGGVPVFFKSAEGAYLTSVEGRRYIDFCQSFGPNILGHRDPDVAKVVREAVEDAWSFGACDPYSLELAEWITARLSFVEKLRFVCSGTEAVMSALRVARAATGRHRILKFEGCYHGHADSLLVKAGSGLAGSAASDSAGVPEALARDTLVAALDDEETVEKIFAEHGSEIAVVILEPLPANFGLLVQRTEFIEKVCEIAREHGALILFDEVISGFRVGLGGMAEKLHIKPDLVTYGKIVGGGFPVGIYGGRADLMDLVAPNGPVYQAGTLAASPVGVRAGLATLQKIERENVYHVLEQRTTAFAATLNDDFKKNDLPWVMAHYASIFWLHARPAGQGDKALRSPAEFDQNMRDRYKVLFHSCLEAGLYLAPSGFEVGFVSLAHTDAVLKEARQIILAGALKAYGK